MGPRHPSGTPVITTPRGILLPESVLTTHWFLVLAAMVAFNTIVYLGLTLAKATPWPGQFHPDRTRARLARLGIPARRPGRRSATSGYDGQHGGHDPDEPLAHSVVRREIPQAFGLMGGVVILYVLAGHLIVDISHIAVDVLEIGTGATLILLSVILSHRRVNPRALMWGWALTCTALVAGQVWDAYLIGNHLPVAYSLLIIVIMAPVTLAWAPALTAGLLMVAIITAVSIPLIAGIEDFRITVLAMVCLMVSIMLLRLRLSAVDALVQERQALEAVAATDPVTGALSRRGLLGLAAGMADNAERSGTEVFVVMVRLLELADANRRYGSAYGDTILETVASVLRHRSRPGDLVGRWTGSRFLVVGMGEPPTAAELAREIDAGIQMSGVATGKRTLAVEVGVGSAAPGDTTFEALIDSAEASLRATNPKSGSRPAATP